MRWAIILLLLANAIVFAWYSQNTAEVPAGRVEDKGAVQLLSEVDTENLLRRSEQASLQKPVIAEELSCAVISGLYTDQEATQLFEALQGYQLEGVLKDLRQDEVLGYEVAVSLPLTVLQTERLQAEGFTLRTFNQQMVAQFVAFSAARDVRIRLAPEIDAEISALERKTGGFEVWISQYEGEETVSKIKLIAARLGLLLKIEKKLCKGVASTQSRE
ncbi:hypothetical protein [Aliamphritea hakodatensis]|uniref:hypothetical protein n=1 Tax=Aliamphritea hakodatensis TaxID=2895352 RepID=UPI0022FDAD54|nr:hypothetical protein [Aliamphritea hakodatensis]